MLRRLLLGNKVQEMVQAVKSKVRTADFTSFTFDDYFDMLDVSGFESKRKSIIKDFGDERYFTLYCFAKGEDYFTQSKEQFLDALMLIEKEHTRNIIKIRYLNNINEISDYEFQKNLNILVEKQELESCIDTQKPEIEHKYIVKQLELEYENEHIDKYEYLSGLNTAFYNKEITISPDSHHEEINLQAEKEQLKIDYDMGKIDYDQYDKKSSTLNKKVWYKFRVNLSKDNPSEWEFDIDYNSYFVEWLQMNGYELPESVINETPEEELDDTLIEYWFKNNMTRISAGFLRSDDGNSFRSVVANDPSSAIIEELEIDNMEKPEGMEDHAFDELVKNIKARKSYR